MTGNHVCSAWLVLWGRPKLVFLLINLSKQKTVKHVSVAALELLLEKDEGGGPSCPPAPGQPVSADAQMTRHAGRTAW